MLWCGLLHLQQRLADLLFEERRRPHRSGASLLFAYHGNARQPAAERRFVGQGMELRLRGRFDSASFPVLVMHYCESVSWYLWDVDRRLIDKPQEESIGRGAGP